MKPTSIRQFMRTCIVAAGSWLLPNVSSAQPFTTGMAAGQVLGQADLTTVNVTPGQSIMRGPGCVAFSSTGKVAVAETNGARVLIWNSIPTANGHPADVVIGQTDFTGTSSGTSATQLSTPGTVAFSPDGSKLLVSDGLNNRVLIYNTVPTTNGAAADVVIGQTDFTTGTGGTSATKFLIPGGLLVAPDGKLLISDQNNNRVLVFNSIPATNGAAADVVIGQTDFVSGGGGVTSSTFSAPGGMALAPDGRLLVTDFSNNRVMIFSSIPTSNGAAAVNVIGQPSFATVAQPVLPAANNVDGPVGVAISPSGQLAISDFSDNRVLIFNSVPTTDGASADAVLGQPDTTSDGVYNPGGTPSATNMSVADQSAYSPDGRLWVPGRNMRRVMVFGTGDYVVTTTGGAITITDMTGNGDTLNVSEPAAGSIRFAATGRTFTVDGAPALLGNSGNLTLAGVTSITVNAAAGNDVVSFGAFTSPMPGLTVNGGTGDDSANFTGSIAFAPNASLDLDMQNDDPVPGTDRVNVGVSAVISTSGTGTIIAKVSRSIAFNVNGTFTTVDGGITLEANQQAVPTAGNFVGIFSEGGQITSTGLGTIMLTGRGGDQAGTQFHYGILIRSNSQISSVGADITLTGRAGSGLDTCIGVGLRSSADITSVTGNINVTGFGATGTTSPNSACVGVYMDGSATLTTTGTGAGVGTITINGTGGNGTGFNLGFGIAAVGTVVKAVDGDISITGVGGDGAGASNIGALVYNGGAVETTGMGASAGNITIGGTGGLGNYGALGVEVIGAASYISVVDGDINITGMAGAGTGQYNEGVGVFDDGVIRSTGVGVGAGTITVTGTGNGAGGGTESNGFSVRSSAALVTSVDGAISVTGTGGTGATTFGIRLGYAAPFAGGSITSTGTAPITFTADSTQIGADFAVSGGTNLVSLRQKTNGTMIDIGAADSAGTLGLTDGELNRITADTVNIGNGDSGAITVSAVISPANYKTLAFGNNTTFAATGGFAADVTSASVYEKMTVTGTVNINPSAVFTAAAIGGYVWNGTDNFVFLANDNTDAITGSFSGPALGSFLGSALTATETYVGLTGNDFVVGNVVLPTVVNVDPPVGGLTGGNVVTITGSGFTGATAVMFNGVLVFSFTVVNDTTITAVVPPTATAGAVPVAVIAPGGTGTQMNAYTYVDYIVTTTATSITVTDASGNSDALAITEPAAGSIKFAAAGRTFSVNAGAPTSGDSGNLSLSGITSITVNNEAGSDTISVSTFSGTTFPSLTINGGKGDDVVNLNGSITFAADANLDLDLQNDDATPGTDTVNVGASAVINTTGTGTITAKVSRRVTMITGAKFTTVDGGITLESNQQAVPTAGNFSGIRLDVATIQSTGTGQIVLKGRGGEDAANANNVGVSINGTSLVSTIGADITFEGRGGASTTFASGVVVRSSSNVTTSGAGNIHLTGLAGPCTDTLSRTYGIYMDGAGTVTSTGTGPAAGSIAMHGTGGTGVTFTIGVVIIGAGTGVSSVDGDISVTGIGGNGTGGSNSGLDLETSAKIRTTGTGANAGNITLNGTGGLGTFGSLGVIVIYSGEVSVVDGDITITGIGGGGSGQYNEGVGVFNSAVRSTGTGPGAGTITLNGTGNGAAGGTESNGVSIRDVDSTVSSVDGAITITGTPGSGATTFGIHVGYAAPYNFGEIKSTGSAPITLIADSMIFDAGATVNSTTSTVTLRQKTNGTQINLGAADSAGVLGLTDAELDKVSAGTLAIGDTNSGMITMSAAISRAAMTNMNFTSGADIVQQAGVDTLGGNVNVSTGTAYGAGFPGTEFAMLGASTGTVSFGGGPFLSLGLGSLASHESLDVVGKVNLTGLGLDLTGAWVPVFNDVMTIVNNDGIDPVIGTFTGFPQGSLVNYNGDNLLISYVGGTGNDVSLTAVGEFVTSGGVLALNEEDFLAPSSVPGTIANATIINGNVTFSDGDSVRLTLPAGKTVTAATAVITNIVGGSGGGVNTPGIIRFKDTGGTTLSSTDFIANGSTSLNLPAPEITGAFVLEMISPTKTTGAPPLMSTSGNAKYVVTLTIGDATASGPAPVSFTLGDVITGANATDATGAQDGTQFDALQRSGYLAENGTLAFLGYLKVGVGGVTNSNFMGYWKEEAGSPTLTRLARMGDSAPETGANAAKFNILPLIPGINEAGQVTLFASLQQSPASTPPTTADNDVGLWSELGGTGFQILIREDDPIPGLGANAPKVDSLGYGCFATAKTSASTGEAAFVVGMKGSSTDTALLRASVVDSDTTQVGFIARENTLAPGTSENFGGLDNNVTRSARMDAQGNVVFGAQLKTTGRIGLWFQPIGGAVQKVLLTGDAAPGTTATFQQLDLPNMGGNGTYAFRGVLNTDGDNANNDKNDGIWKGTAATAPTLILRRGDNNTTRPGLFGSAYTSTYPNIKAGNIYNGWLTNANHGAWLGWVDLGGDGISAFPYDGNFNSSSDTFGIYTDVSGTMTLLTTSGDDAPGIAGSKFFFIDHPVCGGFEQVAFIATVNGGGVTAGQNDKGIWRTPAQGGALALVLRTGDSMTVNINGTISSKTIIDLDIPGSGYAEHIWETPVMDQNGRLLVFVTFADGTTTQVIVP